MNNNILVQSTKLISDQILAAYTSNPLLDSFQEDRNNFRNHTDNHNNDYIERIVLDIYNNSNTIQNLNNYFDFKSKINEKRINSLYLSTYKIAHDIKKDLTTNVQILEDADDIINQKVISTRDVPLDHYVIGHSMIDDVLGYSSDTKYFRFYQDSFAYQSFSDMGKTMDNALSNEGLKNISPIPGDNNIVFRMKDDITYKTIYDEVQQEEIEVEMTEEVIEYKKSVHIGDGSDLVVENGHIIIENGNFSIKGKMDLQGPVDFNDYELIGVGAVDKLQINNQLVISSDAFVDFNGATVEGLGTITDLIVGGNGLTLGNESNLDINGNTIININSINGFENGPITVLNGLDLNGSTIINTGDVSIGGDLSVAGTITGTMADIAERYSTDEIYPIGTVLGINIKGDSEGTLYDGNSPLLGVISNKPFMILNDTDETKQNGYNPPIVLKGKTPVRCSNQVKKGMYLTGSNSNPGLAYGTLSVPFFAAGIIGVALQDSIYDELKNEWITIVKI